MDRDDFKRQIVLPIQLRVCNVAKHWIETSWEDFTASLVQQMFRFINEDIVPVHETLGRKLYYTMVRQVCDVAAGRQAAHAGHSPSLTR